MQNDVERILYSQDQIAEAVNKLGSQITKDYEGKRPLLVCVLKGAVIFFADLLRAIDTPCDMDFLAVSSYGASTKSSGIVKIVSDISQNIENRDVIIVEDIVDSGLTLTHLKELLSHRKPKTIKVCTLLDKKERRKVEFNADYVGFDIPNEFIIGYGLDYAEKYRNLPYIGILKQSVYN